MPEMRKTRIQPGASILPALRHWKDMGMTTELTEQEKWKRSFQLFAELEELGWRTQMIHIQEYEAWIAYRKREEIK